LNDLDIISEGFRGTEVRIWDQFFTFRPVASWNERAFSLDLLFNTECPDGF